MEILPATLDDLDAILPMWTALYEAEQAGGLKYALRPDAPDIWRADCERRLGSKHFCLFIAKDVNGAVLGFVAGMVRKRPPIYQEPLVGVFTELYVRPEARGVDMALKLIHAACDFFRQRGISIVEAQTVAGNAPSQAIWRLAGGSLDFIQHRIDL